MAFDYNSNVFNDELLKDEKILWSGQPDTTFRFSSSDAFLIPFSIFWCGFAIFWEFSVVSSGAPIPFTLWGIPFVLIGLYMVFGRFYYKNYKKKRTFYAVTNQRVLVLSLGRNRSLQAEFIDRIPAVNKTINTEGFGTIKFGNIPMNYGMYLNSGMDFMTHTMGFDVPIFFDINEAEKVYQLVNDLRRRGVAPPS